MSSSSHCGFELCVRAPRTVDAAPISELARSLPELDRYATYQYLLLFDHFADTCAVAESLGQLVGFCTAYRKPREPSTLFVWQVGTAPAAHGKGIATALLDYLLRHPSNRDIRFLETTVAPGNVASRRLFQRLAEQFSASLEELPGYGVDLFVHPHPPEPLLRIGPIPRS